MFATAEATELKSEMIDITPDPHMLFSMSATNMPWWKALAELIDNSLDAKATRVTIQCDGRTVAVADDGKGMPNIATALKMGGHDSHGGQILGRYGVGLKDAWLSCGNRIEIVTTRLGATSSLDFSLDSIKRSGSSWIVPAPKTVQTGHFSGTRITLHLREGKHRPGQDAWDMLSWAFAPAMGSGRQIVKGIGKQKQVLSPTKFPALSESIHDNFEVCGKGVSITIGLLAPGETIFKGPFWVQYGHRNIVNTAMGVNEFSDENLAGIVTLKDGWKLTKNKDDFDDLKDELSEAIHERIKPLLLKSEAMSQDVESSALTAEIAGMLNAAIGSPRREKRTATKETTGTILPKATERKRKNAAKVDPSKPGSVEVGGNRKTGFTISWYADGDELIGEYDYHANRVRLNLGHPLVGQLKAEKNKQALYCLAASVLTDHHCNFDGKSRLLYAVREFAPVFGSLTKTFGGAK